MNGGGSASVCVDGVTTGTLCTTPTATRPFASFGLARVAKFQTLRIFPDNCVTIDPDNGPDNPCADRLINFRVALTDTPFTDSDMNTFSGGGALRGSYGPLYSIRNAPSVDGFYESYDIALGGTQASFVTVISTYAAYFSMREVQLVGAYYGLVVETTTMNAGTFTGNPADNSIDFNFNTHAATPEFLNGGSNWIQFNLGVSVAASIMRVYPYNCLSGSANSCTLGLQSINVYVSNTAFTEDDARAFIAGGSMNPATRQFIVKRQTSQYVSSSQEITSFDVPIAKAGQYVFLMSNAVQSSTRMYLTEVQFFPAEVSDSSSSSSTAPVQTSSSTGASVSVPSSSSSSTGASVSNTGLAPSSTALSSSASSPSSQDQSSTGVQSSSSSSSSSGNLDTTSTLSSSSSSSSSSGQGQSSTSSSSSSSSSTGENSGQSTQDNSVPSSSSSPEDESSSSSSGSDESSSSSSDELRSSSTADESSSSSSSGEEEEDISSSSSPLSSVSSSSSASASSGSSSSSSTGAVDAPSVVIVSTVTRFPIEFSLITDMDLFKAQFKLEVSQLTNTPISLITIISVLPGSIVVTSTMPNTSAIALSSAVATTEDGYSYFAIAGTTTTVGDTYVHADEASSSSLSAGVIAAIVIASVVALLLVGVACYGMRRAKKPKTKTTGGRAAMLSSTTPIFHPLPQYYQHRLADINTTCVITLD